MRRLLPILFAAVLVAGALPAADATAAPRAGAVAAGVAPLAGPRPAGAVVSGPSRVAAVPVATRVPAATPPSGPSGGLAGHIVVIDPGHGLDPRSGTPTGARGANGVSEDANALDIAQRLAVLLRADGATVYLTRGKVDPGPPPVQGLIARVNFAEQHHAQVFVSIHQNDSPSPALRGMTTYYDHAGSRRLATLIQGQLVGATGLRNLGVHTASFHVIRQVTMPAVLVEGGFLSNPTEARLISTGSFHQSEAVGIERGLLAYFSSGTAAGSVKGTGSAGVTVAAHAPAPATAGRAAGSTLRLASGRPAGRFAGATGPRPVTRSATAAGGPAPQGRTIAMVATAYGTSLKDNYPYGPTDYYGKPLKAGDVAVDPRVIPLGTRLYVTGYHSPNLPAGGFYGVARDTGGAIKGDRIDIFLNASPAAVSAFGVQHVRVTIVG